MNLHFWIICCIAQHLDLQSYNQSVLFSSDSFYSTHYCNIWFISAIDDVAGELSPKLKLFKFSNRPLHSRTEQASGDASNDFTALLENTPPATWSYADGDGFTGKLLYIYTSGTTGLPKAAVISNAR